MPSSVKQFAIDKLRRCHNLPTLYPVAGILHDVI